MVNQTRILLVNPKCLDARISGEDAAAVPIGLFYIAALLIEKGFDARIINLAQADTGPLDLFNRALQEIKPDIIGFSVMNPSRWNAIECAQSAKNQNPAVKIVFGGPAATFMTEALFRICPQIDFMVKGEGEWTFLELVERLKQHDHDTFHDIKGLAFQAQGRIIHTPLRDLCPDLDLLPHPSRYFTYQHLGMSRGCPGNCTFCGSPRFWGQRRVRFHSARWFAEEIKALALKDVRHFYISDDTFTMDRERVIEFCRLIEKNVPGITWNAISRVDYIDEDVMLAMRKAGCIQISYGVESGSGKIRKTLGKPMAKEKITKAFSLTRRYGILPRVYFIYGSPGETNETITQSIKLMKEIQPLGAIFYLLVIFPGTWLYRSAVREKKVSDNIFDRKIEDLPWFEVDPKLDLDRVKKMGDKLRSFFYANICKFTEQIDLIDKKELYPYHADFLSRLGMTFSHGEFSQDPRVSHAESTATALFEKALAWAPDARAYMGLSMLLQRQKKFEPAVALLEKGIQQFSGNPDLNICMGICLMNMGRFKRAIEYFQPFADLPQTRQYIEICQQKMMG